MFGKYLCFVVYVFIYNRICTDKKEKKIFRINKEILNGAVAKSYMINGFFIYGEIFVYEFATAPL